LLAELPQIETDNVAEPPECLTGDIEVVIAEPDDISRCGLRQILSSPPGVLVVGEALDAAEAFSMLTELRPDVLILDVDLPGLDCVESIVRMRELVPTTRLVVLAASEDDANIYRSLGAGAIGFCLKNTSADRLRLAVESVARGAGWLDPHLCRRVFTATALAFSRAGPQPPAEFNPEALLSDREMDVMRLLAQGLSNKEIAERLVLSPETIKTHLKHIMEKLSVRDRTQAVLLCLQKGIVDW
jgi:DNA-binding NarL/FixJ family response regulator